MKPLKREASDCTPAITFDPDASILSLKGKSVPTSESEFFQELIQWVDQYSLSPNESTKMEIDLKYMNARSIRSLLILLKKLQSLNESGKNVSVEWSIPKGADDLLEISEDLFTGVSVPHKIVLN